MITLENKYLKLNIKERGAQWTSLFDKENKAELLWQGSSKSWVSQAPLLFPIIGKLKDDSYIYHGQLYKLDKHGFLRSLQPRLVQQSDKEVTFEFEQNFDTKRVYPFDFKLRVTYTLKKNRVITKLVVLNDGDSTMYYNIGGHPGLNIDHEQENLISFKTKNKHIGQFLLDGPFVNGYEKFKYTEMFLDEIDLESTLILDGVSDVVLSTPDYEYSMSMKPAHYFAFWAPNNKETHELDNLVCLEPWWGISDCIDANQQLKDKKGILKLEPNSTDEFEFSLRIEKNMPTLKVPEAIGPYSTSRTSEELIYTSGQLPLNPETNQIEVFSIEEQTHQVLTNVKAVLNQNDAEMSDVIKTTVFLKNMDDFSVMNEIYGEYFSEPYPARSAIEVARLPKDALVEIEVIAQKK